MIAFNERPLKALENSRGNILKITKTFDTPLKMADSPKTGTETVFTEPEFVNLTADSPGVEAAQNALNMKNGG